MQVEGNPGAGRRQIPGGDAQGAGDPGQPGESIHSSNICSRFMSVEIREMTGISFPNLFQAFQECDSRLSRWGAL